MSGRVDVSSWTMTQVGIVVKDVEQVVARLGELGIGPFDAMKLPPDRQEWVRGEPMFADAKIMGARIGGTQLELIQPIAAKSPRREFLDSKGEGIEHIMFSVADLNKDVKALTSKGCTILLKAVMPGGRQIAYVDLNAGGIVLELVQK